MSDLSVNSDSSCHEVAEHSHKVNVIGYNVKPAINRQLYHEHARIFVTCLLLPALYSCSGNREGMRATARTGLYDLRVEGDPRGASPSVRRSVDVITL